MNKSLTFPPQHLIYFLIFTAFGPYVISGIRLGQLAVYFLAIFLLLLNRIRLKREESVLAILITSTLLFFIPFFGLVSGDNSISNTLIISQIENYLTPIVVFIIALSLLRHKNQVGIDEVMNTCIKIFLVLLCLNSIFSVYLFSSSNEYLLTMFTGTREVTFGSQSQQFAGETAASLALSAGRIPGVFTQVFEAGTAYSFGLVCFSYIRTIEPKKITRNLIILLMILVGGTLTFSKVFFLIGSLATIYFLGITRLIKILIIIFPILAVTLIYFPELEIAGIPFGQGFASITRLFVATGGISIEVLTSGRFGPQSDITRGMLDVFAASPIFGLGFGSIETSDFSLYEVISIGGMLALLTYLFLFFLFIFFAAVQKAKIDRKFFLAIIFIAMIASLGGPIITANRIAIIFWIFISLMCLKLRKDRGDSSPKVA